MTIKNKPIIYTIKAFGPGGEVTKSSYAAVSEEHARFLYHKFYKDRKDWRLEIIRPTSNNRCIYELHTLAYGSKFQKVQKHGKLDDNEYQVASCTLTKFDFMPVNRTYMCLDEEGNTHFIDAYQWCIRKD